MRTIQEITDEVNYLVNQGLTPRFDTSEKIDAEIDRIVKKEAKEYLNQTDWYIVRFLETAIPVPAEVTSNREAARLIAN